MGEVAWLRGQEKDRTQEEGIFVAYIQVGSGIKGNLRGPRGPKNGTMAFWLFEMFWHWPCCGYQDQKGNPSSPDNNMSSQQRKPAQQV